MRKSCAKCCEQKDADEFSPDPRGTFGLHAYCKDCNRDRQRKRREARKAVNPYRHIFWQKKTHAKSKGIPFDLEFDDIEWPDVCPVLGIPLDYSFPKSRGPHPNWPSFDRVDPSLGYVKGNVVIVSMRANRLKCDGTVDELERVARFYRQFIQQRLHEEK